MEQAVTFVGSARSGQRKKTQYAERATAIVGRADKREDPRIDEPGSRPSVSRICSHFMGRYCHAHNPEKIKVQVTVDRSAVSKETLSSAGQRFTETRVVGRYPQKIGSAPLSR